MASFFRKRISQKLLVALDKCPQSFQNIIPSLVNVNCKRCKEPQLLLPLNGLTHVFKESNVNLDFERILRTMKNQGLPTAEGIIDININNNVPQSFAFTIDKHIFHRIVLLDICLNLSNLPKNSCLFQNNIKKNVVFHYRSPPIGQMFSMEDFQILLHYNFMANIFEYIGMQVTRLNHVEDWGPLCNTLLSGYQEFGIDEELQINAAQHLNEVSKATYVKNRNDIHFAKLISECAEKMREGDPTTLSLWTKVKESWWKSIKDIFKALHIDFDITQFDSSLREKVDHYSDILCERGIVNIENANTMNIKVSTADGSSYESVIRDAPEKPLYSVARDIASIVQQKEIFGFDSMYFVGKVSQSNYYDSIFQILKNLNFTWSSDLFYARIKETKWLTQKKFISAETVLNKAKTYVIQELKMDTMLELEDNQDDVAEKLAHSGVISNILQRKRNENSSFDLDECLQFSEKSGIGFQFLHAGLVKIQEDSDIKFNFDIDLSPLWEKEAVHLIQHLARFDEVIFKSYTHLKPHYLVDYISSLCYFTNVAINTLRLDIKEDRLRVIKARLLLFHATQKILHECLKLLGIRPLENV